ncbi:MAG: histidine kinase [Planctomycetes bacterium]|nr:histidine kinase [Planctomycetota bacterium]
MYAKSTPRTPIKVRSALTCLTLGLAGLLSIQGNSASAQQSVIQNITNGTERLELTVNSSRILTLEKRIPKMVVNNPDLVTVTALSANQIQLAARKPGVTQVNLWDEEGKVYTVDVTIYGDVRELQLALKRLFPSSSVNVVRLTNSLVLEGFVERPEAVSPIIRLAEDYAPKIINNISVGGVQQVLLKVKVMEVSRTKLRRLGVDWAQISGQNIVASSVSSLINSVNINPSSATFGNQTFAVGVVNGNNSFAAIINALQQNNVAKVLADPTIVAISGRPAHFNVGGEIPIVVPSGLGQNTIEYKPFGTQIDFLPIVLGNGNIRLEVRPRISEIDDSRSVVLNSFTVPGLRVRTVDTAVELKSGQTLALAGLVQTRVDAIERGLPFVSDIPYIGAAFRSVEEEVNEIELLIMVTPEFVDGMEPHEVPPCGPGMETVSPSNRQLYFGGHLEVPTCGLCAPGNCGGQNCSQCSSCNSAGGATIISDVAYPSNAGQPYREVSPPMLVDPAESMPIMQPEPVGGNPDPAYQSLPDPTASNPSTQQGSPWLRQQMPAQFSRDNRSYRSAHQPRANSTTTPGLIGPLGYDVEN